MLTKAIKAVFCPDTIGVSGMVIAKVYIFCFCCPEICFLFGQGGDGTVQGGCKDEASPLFVAPSDGLR